MQLFCGPAAPPLTASTPETATQFWWRVWQQIWMREKTDSKCHVKKKLLGWCLGHRCSVQQVLQFVDGNDGMIISQPASCIQQLWQESVATCCETCSFLDALCAQYIYALIPVLHICSRDIFYRTAVSACFWHVYNGFPTVLCRPWLSGISSIAFGESCSVLPGFRSASNSSCLYVFLLWQGSNAICIHLSFWIPIRSIFRLEVVFFFVFFFSTQNLGFFKQHGSISPESNWNWSRSRPLLSAASNSKDDSFWARILLVAWYLARIFLATRVYSYGVSSFWPSKTTNLLVLLASTALPILFPLGKAKREDSWSNSEPWGKQARDSSGRSCRGQCSTTPVGLWEACTSLSNLSLSLSISIYIYI